MKKEYKFPLFSEDFYTSILTDGVFIEKMVLINLVKEILSNKRETTIEIITFKYKYEEIYKVIENLMENELGFSKEETLKKILVTEPKEKNIEKLLSESNLYCKENLIIMGGERLCSFKESELPHIKNYYGETQIKLFTPEQLDIEQKIIEIKDYSLKLKSQISKLVIFFETNPSMGKMIVEQFLDHEHIEVTSCMTNQYSEENLDLPTILKTVASQPISESIKYIENFTEKVSEENILIMKFAAYTSHGYREEALKILQSVYMNLEDSMKIIYANILNSEEYFQEAYSILLPLFKYDKWIPGLLGPLLISSKALNVDEREKIITEILEFDSSDSYLLQEAANFFFKIDKYAEAGHYFRVNFNLTKNRYFDMLARISELLSNPPQKVNEAEAYLHSIIQEDPNLENEIYYRTALICKDIYKSLYKYYENLKNIKVNHNFTYSNQVVKMKLEVLKANDEIEKILKLKPLANSRDLAKVKNLRIDELLDGVEFLFLEDHGYWDLQSFIDDAQSENDWNLSILQKLDKELDNWNSYNLDEVKLSLKNSSEVEITIDETTLKVNEIIEMIRSLKKIDIKNSEKIEMVNSTIAIMGDKKNRINESWLRYEAALLMSYIGDFQKANEHALVILNRFNREKNSKDRDILFALGIGAWAVSQYKVGRKVDGIICAILAIRKGLEYKNYYIMENAINLLFLFMNNDVTKQHSSKEKFIEFKRKLMKSVNEYSDGKLAEIEDLLSLKKWKEANRLLKEVLGENKINDINAATNMFHYITTFITLNQEKEAYQLIKEHVWDIINLFDKRLDHRWKVILQFSHVLFKSPQFVENGNYFKDLELAKDILQIAIKDIEKQRSEIFHMKERSSYSDFSQDAYKTYLDVLMMLSNPEKVSIEEKNRLDEEIVEIMFKISPRTVIEKKISETNLSDDLDKKSNEYLSLYNELLEIDSDIASKDYSKKIKKFEELKEELMEQHSAFQSLPLIEKIDLSQIQVALRDEVFYQYCLTYFGFASITVTKETYKLSYALGESEPIINSLISLGRTLSESDDLNAENLIKVENECENITSIIFKDLISHIEQGKNSLIVCPDMSIPYFTPSLMRDSKGWLINRLEKVVNLVSPSELSNSINKKEEYSNQKIISIGSKNNTKDKKDDAIPLANKWLADNEKLFDEIVNEFGENNNEILSILNKRKPKLFTLVGHGIEAQDNHKNINGAVKILGPNKKYLNDSDLEVISSVAYTVFYLTCQSGQPEIKKIQSGNNVWKNTVSQKSNLILCRWDVHIIPGLKVLEEISSVDSIDISKKLLTAQKKLLNGSEWSYPSAWASFEYWGLD